MNPDLPKLWKAVHPCLEKASVKKTLHYEFVCCELGQVYKHAPKYLDVRFRYSILLARFFEEHNRSLYKYFREVADKYESTRAGTLPSENETTVISIFLGDYVKTRLCHMFLIAAGDPFLKFIEFFESSKVLVHLIFPKTSLLLSQHLSFFLKSGGRDAMAPAKLLEVDFKEADLQLSRKDVFIGSKAREFIKKIGLTCDSPELSEFFQGVTSYYHESTAALLKYAKVPLSNPFVSALMVLDPVNKEKETLASQRKMWDCLATQLNHIVTSEEKETLLTAELVGYQGLEAAEEGDEVDLWWAMVAKVTLGGERQFTVLSKLALAAATIACSSSEVEREFSGIESIFADSRVSYVSQELIDAKMTVRSSVKAESKNCARCIEHEKDRMERRLNGEVLPRKECKHCHCSLLETDDRLLADLRNCEPAKKYAEEVKKKTSEAAEEKKELEKKKLDDDKEAEKDLVKEVSDMKRRFQEARVKALKEGKEVATVKVPKKRVGIEKASEAVLGKQKKLSFLFHPVLQDNEGNHVQGPGAATKAGGEEKRPRGDEKRPRGDEKRPRGDEKRPRGDEKRPSSDEKRPSSDEKRPSSDEKRSRGDEKRSKVLKGDEKRYRSDDKAGGSGNGR